MRQAWSQCVFRLLRPLPPSTPSLCSSCSRLTQQRLPPSPHIWQQQARLKTSATFRKPASRRALEKREKEKCGSVDTANKVHPSVRAREDLLARSRAGNRLLFLPHRLKHPVDDADKALRAKFDELQRLLQKPKDPEAIWLCYDDIRKNKDALGLMSPDLYRLLVLHFKTAGTTAATAARSQSISASNARKLKISQKTWAARVTTVLVDKREHCKDNEFTKWETSDMMAALNRGERYEEALQELDRCLAAGEAMDPILLNHAVRAWGGLKRLDKAIELIQDKKYEHVAKASEYTLGYMLQQFLLHDQRERALDMWTAIRMLPMENPKTAEGILRVCATKKDVQFAQMVYEELPKMGIEATVDSLDIMAGMAVSKVNSNADRAQILQSIYSRMMDSDKPVFRPSILESILVNFCKKGDMEGAMLAVHLMDHYGIPTSLRYHNALLRGFAAAGDLSGATHWFNYMRREGCAPDLTSYRTLVTAFVKHRRPREAEALFRQMLVDRLQPDLMLCNQLLRAYEHAKMTRRCLQLYLTMFRDRLGLNHESFSCLFNAVFHQEKAVMEGGEGHGTSMGNRRFLDLISEPIAKNRKKRQVGDEEQQKKDEACTVHPPERQLYQYPNAISHTTDLTPRSLFRDMIIVGILPTTTLYGNILRAFLVKGDDAGAYVALRVMADYHLLKPTPKISAIVLSWVYAELERRGPSEANTVTKGELAKLSHMMGRTRGLIDMLERMIHADKRQPHQLADASIRQDILPTPTKQETHNQEGEVDAVAKAFQEMGGDLVDLSQRGVYSGSSQKTFPDQAMQVDLNDFERWFESYLPRVRRQPLAGSIDEEDPELD